MPSKDSVELLEGWKGVVTGADSDVLPGDLAPKGQNAVITHAATETGAVRRRKGATPQGSIENNPAVLGIFDFPSAEYGKLFLVVTADGGLSTIRVSYIFEWDTPAAIVYGTVLGASQLNANADVEGVYTYVPPAGTLLTRGTHTLYCTFTPDNAVLYSIRTLSVQQVVDYATPVITWATPAGIDYGVALSGTQLNATADVPGTFVYTPPAGTVLGAGTHTLRVDFTPTDTANYQSTYKEVTIGVAKVNPVITWANPSGITYGTALSGTQLNATADVAGVLTYTPPSGTVLNAGMGQTLHVNFVPTDTANYNNASADVSINVSKATPVITWSNPADIRYPAALSATQLNATANVAGSFVYTPPSGTVLAVGNAQNLHADFTPTDTTNYNLVDYNVSINVLWAELEDYWMDGLPMEAIYNGLMESGWIDGLPNPEPGT